MREECLKPLANLQTNAKLLMENRSVLCVIVAVTADGFRVAVPGIEQYEGDPKITLVTPDAVFPVRLVLQEPHVGGFSYRLQRMEAILPSKDQPRLSARFRLYTSSCCAAGLISIITTSYYAMPWSNEAFALLNRRNLRHESTGNWSPSIAENDRVPPGISVDKSLVTDLAFSHDTNPYRGELEPSPFSMISSSRIVTDEDEFVPSSAGQGNHEQSSAASNRKPKRDVSLKSLLHDGQTGRARPASRELLNWMNHSAPWDERVSFRLSDAAWLDLQQFEIALKDVPREFSDQAVDSLRQAIHTASLDLRSSGASEESSNVFAVNCDDASIYFRKIHGQMELVRVLPIPSCKVTQQ